MRRREEERDDAAVGVPDDVGSRLHKPLEPDRLVLEIDALDVRSRRESAPVRQPRARSGRRAASAPPRSAPR